MKIKKKLHRMRATGVFKLFRSKVLHVAWSEPQRKRGVQVLIQLSTHSVKYPFSEVLFQ